MKTQILLAIVLVLCTVGCFARNVNLEREISSGRMNATEADLLMIFKSYGYQPNPKSERFALFKSKLLQVIKHNLNPHKTFTRGINKFSFLKKEEIAKLNSNQNCSATAQLNSIKKRNFNLSDLPSQVDWRRMGVVTPVKDQGNCGSCWTFSTTGAIESHWSLFTGNAPPLLSEQQLVDCAGDYDNHGCNGGLPSQAFEYVAHIGGIETEGNYPYMGTDGDCSFSSSQVAAKVIGSYNITAMDETELIHQLALVGPISIAFQVTDSFMDYTSGVFSDPDCSVSPEEVNHAVLVVGYNMTGNYYIVKNSWSEEWGEKGYFNIEMGTNMCGLADCASYPLIEKNKASA